MKQVLIICISFLLFISMGHFVSAQNTFIPVQCGAIIEGELTSNDLNPNKTYTIHRYTMEFNAGDRVTVRVEPIGSYLDVIVGIWDPRGEELIYDSSTNGNTAQIDTVLSASGDYKVIINGQSDGKIGAYEAFFGCTFRDGKVINPGDVVIPTIPSPPTIVPTLSPQDPGFRGFNGLSPVDFSEAFVFPFNIGQSNNGQIPPAADAVIAYTFDATANDALDLSFTRLSGNLNLGVAVLSPDNKIIFFGTLVTSESLATKLTLPSMGQYTIGVFKLELLPPATPENTAFQVMGTLNP